ncbi:MAG: hypothetical protein IJ598_10990 [Ruminococcus sp.]|nr:hypothetical protein [Ruminococcus sp.]
MQARFIALKAESVACCDKAKLIDLSGVQINTQKSSAERVSDYLEQLKNPYLFRVGDIAVRVEYCGEKTLSDSLVSVLKAS